MENGFLVIIVFIILAGVIGGLIAISSSSQPLSSGTYILENTIIDCNEKGLYVTEYSSGYEINTTSTAEDFNEGEYEQTNFDINLHLDLNGTEYYSDGNYISQIYPTYIDINFASILLDTGTDYGFTLLNDKNTTGDINMANNQLLLHMDDNFGGEYDENSGTLALYHLNEIVSGTTIEDDSGNDYDGTIGNTPIISSDGIFGNSLKFDATNEYVNTGSSWDENISDNATISFWIKPARLSGAKRIICSDVWYSSLGQMCIHTNNQYIYWQLGVTGVPNIWAILTLNTWQHIVVTWDRPNNTMAIYKNGVLINQNTAVGAGTIGASADIFIGSWGNTLLSNMDEIVVWDETKDLNEIKEIYAKADKTIKDDSGNDYDGTVNSGNVVSIDNGVFDKAIELNGAEDINFGYISRVNDLNEFSFSAWIYPRDKNKNILFSLSDDSSGNGMRVGFNTDGFPHLEFVVFSSSRATEVTKYIKTDVETNDLNKWQHIACTVNTNIDSNNVNCWWNGIKEETDWETLEGSIRNEGSLILGNIYPNIINQWDGYIDEFAFWSEELSEDDIINIYNSSAGEIKVKTRVCADDNNCESDWTYINAGEKIKNNTEYILNYDENINYQYLIEFISNNNILSPIINSVTTKYYLDKETLSISADIVPSETDVYRLGSSDRRWKELWVQEVITTSDKKKKEDIENVEIDENDLKDIKIKKFKYESDKDGKEQIGFIAQDLEAVLPEAVYHNEFNDEYGINYASITAYMWGIMQKQQEQIEFIESELCEKNNKYAFCN